MHRRIEGADCRSRISPSSMVLDGGSIRSLCVPGSVRAPYWKKGRVHLLFGSVAEREREYELNRVTGKITRHLPGFRSGSRGGLPRSRLSAAIGASSLCGERAKQGRSRRRLRAVPLLRKPPNPVLTLTTNIQGVWSLLEARRVTTVKRALLPRLKSLWG